MTEPDNVICQTEHCERGDHMTCARCRKPCECDNMGMCFECFNVNFESRWTPDGEQQYAIDKTPLPEFTNDWQRRVFPTVHYRWVSGWLDPDFTPSGARLYSGSLDGLPSYVVEVR